jgi:hypothetical protein
VDPRAKASTSLQSVRLTRFAPRAPPRVLLADDVLIELFEDAVGCDVEEVKLDDRGQCAAKSELGQELQRPDHLRRRWPLLSVARHAPPGVPIS